MTEKNKLMLSIVIPVYNVEEYLRECLDSILGQDYDNFEVILVDNNSTDKSYEICEEYAKKNPGVVRVYKCEAQGAAAARNFGVREAKGKYLWFIDSDDYIEQGAIRKLVEKAEESEADVVVLAMRRIYGDGHEDVLTAIDTTKPNWKSRYAMYGIAPVQNFYRREFWTKYFEFPEGMIHEDMAVLSAAVLYTDKASFVEEPLYNYWQRSGSVLHQKSWNPHALDIFKALGILYGRFKEAGKVEEYHDELEYFFIWNLLIDSAKDFYVGFCAGPYAGVAGSSRERAEKKAGQEQSREMLKKFFPKWRKNRFFRQKPLKFRLNCYRGYLGLLK